jgi:ribose transport system ATP-binding protein
MTTTVTDAVALAHVSKRFGSTQALEAVDFSVRAGEVHGLVGLNGSGKSTLLKVLSGYVTPAPGATCRLWGADVPMPLRSAWRHGIASVPQTLALNNSLTVLDNVNVAGALGGGHSAAWRIRRRQEAEQLRAVFADLGWSLDPMSEIRHLTPGERAIVAIARAFASTRLEGQTDQPATSSCVVLDEPTAYLTQDDTDRLLRAIGRLVSAGDSAILVSHRMGDIFSACQRVTVLREGHVVAVEDVAASSKANLVALMAGSAVSRTSSNGAARRRHQPSSWSPPSADESAGQNGARQDCDNGRAGPGALELRGLRSGALRHLDLRVPRGQVVGCTGLVGSGIDDLPYAIIGYQRREGEVVLDGKLVPRRPAATVAAGLALVPADRGGQALWLGGSLVDNAVALPGAARWGGLYVSRKRARQQMSAVLTEFDVVARGPDARASQLSGGNQQKLVVARALSSPGLRTLVLHEPTSGVDVTARAAIHAMVRRRAASGLAVLVCSSDIEEIVDISDWIVVLVNGQVAREFSGQGASVDEVALACS